VCEHKISIKNDNGAREINQNEVRSVEGTVESLESTVRNIDAVPFADLANSDAMKWLGISCGFIASMKSARGPLNEWHKEDKDFLEHFQTLIKRAVAARKVCATIHHGSHCDFFALDLEHASIFHGHFSSTIFVHTSMRACVCVRVAAGTNPHCRMHS
jgi:hypothetical protein